MASYSSGSIYFSGIGNGTDFSNIVDQLKKVESIPMQRMEIWKADWQKRYEAFGYVIAAVRDAKTALSELNSPQKFLLKTAASSNQSVLTAKANALAADGTHTIEVKQLASNSIWASTSTFANKSTNINTTATAQDFTYTYKGTRNTVSVPKGTTLESFANLVNQDSRNPGVRVSVIQVSGGYTFQIQGQSSGTQADLNIHPSNLFGGSGSATSTWLSNAPIDNPSASFASMGTAIKPYEYKLTMADNSIVTLNIDGDRTQQQLVAEINTATGTNTASIVNGKLIYNGVKSVNITPQGGTTTNVNGSVTVQTSLPANTELGDPIGIGGTNYDFTLTLPDNSTETITLDGDSTWQDLINDIRSKGGTVKITGNSTDGFALDITGIASLSDDPNNPRFASPPVEIWKASQTVTAQNTIQSGVVPHNLTYSFTLANGTPKTIALTNDKSMNDLIDEINTQFAPDASATLVTQDGKQYLQLNNINLASGYGIKGQVQSSSQWSIRHATDAIFKVDNWPQELVSSSNTVDNVLEGVTLTLTDIGTAKISIAADLDSVKKNIQSVLDIINTVVKTVQVLTKYDDKKQTSSTNPSASNYSPSQFDSEKGSVLTGNYGVQLFNTRLKTLTTGSPPGFKNIQGSDVFSGDFVATLSQIGIKTCTEVGNPNYGLFMVAPPGGSQQVQLMDMDRFDAALSDNLEDVIRFFAADDEGSTNSSAFRYNGHIKGITKAGTYNVSYSVDTNGNPFDVKINGARANPSDEPGVYTVGQAGDATGMSIKIDDLTPGSHSGQVSVKQGKIRQMEDFFTAELVYYTPDPKEPMIGEKNGALMILQANYQQIMDNIDKKIAREQTRLEVWERTQRLAFSRLETLLGDYDRSQTNLTSQLKQLGSE